MDVNIVYFATHGSTATEPTSWSAIIIEDGEMESLSGFEPSSLTATLSGLEHCLSRLPSSTPIIIRSPERSLHQIGSNWIANWQRDGWEHEPDSEFITALLETMESRKIQWFKPPFSDPLDKQVQTLALEEWNNIPEPLPSITTDSATTVDPVESSLKITSDREDSSNDNLLQSSNVDVHTNTVEPPIASSEVDINNRVELQVTPTPESPTEGTPQQNIDAPIETLIDTTEEDIRVEETNEGDDVGRTEPLMEEDHSILTGAEDVIQAPLPVEPLATYTQLSEPNKDTLEAMSDEILYPYIDAEGLKQANEIFCARAEPSVIEYPTTRMLGYIDAVGYGLMGSWCFILIDYPSQFALIKGQANRNSTGRRALLQGCIEVLMSIRDRSHRIEIRTSNLEMFELVQSFIQDPLTVDIPSCWADEGAFVSQLSYWIEQCNVSVRLLTDIERQTDQAIRETAHLARNNLSNINQGLRATLERRRKFYPLSRLVE